MEDDVSEALHHSEQRYRTLFEQAPIGVFLYGRDLVIREVNQRFAEILRSTPERLVGLDMRTLRDPSVLPTLERALLGEMARYQGGYSATTSEAHVTISMTVAPLRDARGEVIGAMGLVEDVGDRVRAEAALRASEQRLAVHVERSPLGVVVFDLKGRIVEWNPAATRIFGWRQDEVVGRPAGLLLVPPHVRETVTDVFRALLAGRGGERSVHENLTKDERIILCDWYNTALFDPAGVVIGVASIIDDITERRQRERALERSETRFRMLIESAPDAIAVYAPDDRRLVYVNSAFASLVGYDTPQEMLGVDIDAFYHPDERHLIELRRAKLRSQRGPLPPQEHRMVRKDGGISHAEFVSMVIEYDGKPNIILFGRDLTERKQMQARLLLADRLVSVGTLAAGVAHEINNPLTYVMANLDLVATRHLPPLAVRLRELGGEAAQIGDEVADAVTRIDVAREGSGRMRDIVRDLRTFTRGAHEEQRTAVDVRQVLDAAINLAWNEIRHRARLVKSYDDVPPVLATEARLAQVFLNILVNAAQALQVGDAARNVIRVLALNAPGGHVAVEVADTGPGIPPEIMGRIFDPFFTTKPVGLGTGLGLWICQGIVTSLGGHITVEGPPGGGATFRVVLPGAANDLPAPAPAAAPPEATPGARRLRLLVVDDEVALGRTLAIALADELEVSTATSGREALARLEQDRDYDVVLCDLMMPDVSGMDVYERVVEQRPELARRFVFVTGGAFTERARAFVERASLPLVEKPFKLGELSRLLRERAYTASRTDD